MIRLFSNRFHETSARITIRDMSVGMPSLGVDCLADLHYEIESRGEDAPYARRKLTEIKRKLCPAGSHCRCVHIDEGTLEPVSSVRRVLADIKARAK